MTETTIERACEVAHRLARANAQFWRLADLLDEWGESLSPGVRFTLEEDERRWRAEAMALEAELARLVRLMRAELNPTLFDGARLLAEVRA